MATKTTELPSPPTGSLVPELRSILEDLRATRGAMNVSVRMYPVSQRMLGAWQEKLDATIARAESLLQDA